MKKLIVLVTAALAAVGAMSAHAQKGGPATAAILDGGKGVVSPDGKTRYVTLTTGRQTMVSFVRTRGGKVVRWRVLPGYYGVPLVGLDGTTDGVSKDGRTLVLASPGPQTTRFALLDTTTTRLRQVALSGIWSFDAISPDGSVLYLIQYTGLGANPAYKVRAYDVAGRRLFARSIVDSDIGERLMRGWALTRKTSSDGRWAYTLYAREKKAPFVHALDTVRRLAYCIDLPLDLKRSLQMTLRLSLRGNMLQVRRGSASVAAIDTKTLVVHQHGS
jgi:hypothetical protein